MTQDEVTEPDDQQPDEETASRSNWEFWDQPPTTAEVKQLLSTLRPVYGVEYIRYLDYVQALPQTKKVQAPRNEKGQRGPVQDRDTWALYMSVGGRIAMLNEAAEHNGWAVEFRPEMHTPDGCPVGFLEFTDRIVYREYLVIEARVGDVKPDGNVVTVLLGSKPGTAWVPRTGGKQAKGSNPYEKVETAARGRAIAAWGIGVLPGSGVASLEEMQGMAENRRAIEAGGQDSEAGRAPQREDLLQDMLLAAEELRQLRGITEQEATARTGEYLSTQLGVTTAYDPQTHTIDWSRVKTGQLMMLRNSLRKTIRDAKIDAAAAGNEDV